MAKNENFELTEEDFKPQNVKERISIMLDQDILDHFRSKAKSEHSKYQTLINAALREHLSEEASVKDRLKKLEDHIFKKEA